MIDSSACAPLSQWNAVRAARAVRDDLLSCDRTLHGGNTMFPGMGERLATDLMRIAPSSMKVKVTRLCACVSAHTCACLRSCARMRACLRVCVCVFACALSRMCACACARAHARALAHVLACMCVPCVCVCLCAHVRVHLGYVPA
jgi:hypothetical protein